MGYNDFFRYSSRGLYKFEKFFQELFEQQVLTLDAEAAVCSFRRCRIQGERWWNGRTDRCCGSNQSSEINWKISFCTSKHTYLTVGSDIFMASQRRRKRPVEGGQRREKVLETHLHLRLPRGQQIKSLDIRHSSMDSPNLGPTRRPLRGRS